MYNQRLEAVKCTKILKHTKVYKVLIKYSWWPVCGISYNLQIHLWIQFLLWFNV